MSKKKILDEYKESFEIVVILICHLITAATLFLLIAGFAVIIDIISNKLMSITDTDGITVTILTYTKHSILIIDVLLLIIYVARVAYQTVVNRS